VKKLVVIISTFVLLMSLASCNAKTPNNASKPNITYTKEFSYLPAYSGMELQSITQPDKNKQRTAKYTIKNITTDKLLTEYADILKKDGWTVNFSLYKDGKPFSASALKGTHVATLVPQQKGNDIILTIISA
jgi:hypothetical protein